jgi:hypothetical protein
METLRALEIGKDMLGGASHGNRFCIGRQTEVLCGVVGRWD